MAGEGSKMQGWPTESRRGGGQEVYRMARGWEGNTRLTSPHLPESPVTNSPLGGTCFGIDPPARLQDASGVGVCVR